MLLCCLIPIAFACQNNLDSATQAEGESLLLRLESLHCEDRSYQTKVDSLWDEVSARLDEKLPRGGTLDAADRANLVKLRNTSLIKMFNVYPLLDTTTRNMVDRAGKVDSSYTVAIKDLHARQEAFEQEQARFLSKLETKAPKLVKTWATKFIATGKGPCR
jgi:hypothetical protein